MIKGIKMAQIILAFRLDKEKLKTVRSTAQKTGFQVKEISRKDYSQKLGTLAGIEGFSRKRQLYDGPEFPLEMMVFSGTDSAQLDTFLNNYKQTGAQPVPLKAVITQHNIFWTAENLYKELLKEHMHFNR